MFSARNADDIPHYVRLCTQKGAALWGTDFALDTKAIRYPLVVYLHSPFKTGTAQEGVQAYGTATRVVCAPSAVGPSNMDWVPSHLRAAAHRTWFHFDQILNVTPSVPHSEFYTVQHERLAGVAPNTPIWLGPPYPVRK
jgi:hypothetical protein